MLFQDVIAGYALSYSFLRVHLQLSIPHHSSISAQTQFTEDLVYTCEHRDDARGQIAAVQLRSRAR